MARQAKGYALIELVVVILIFSIVMTLIAVSFNRIVASSAQIIKAAETDIGGLIGLELLRSDLELAGFGLPWSLPSGVTYSEAPHDVLVDGCPGGCLGADAYLYNDAPSNAPRGVAVGNNVGLNGSDYLVLKGTALGMSATSRRWSYLNYSSSSALVKPAKSEVELTPDNGDRVIVLRSGSSEGAATRELVTDGIGSSFSLTFNLPLPTAFQPKSKLESYLVYGVAPRDDEHPLLAFPFNRADYYLTRPDEISKNCAPGTGVLYKTTWNHDGKHTSYPILDCVADLQVFFHLDSNGDGEGDLHAPDFSGTDHSAAAIREQVREIRVYILAQQGRMDPNYLYPVQDPNKAIVVGDAALDQSRGQLFGSAWSEAALAERFGAGWRHYHWKTYAIALQPRNL